MNRVEYITIMCSVDLEQQSLDKAGLDGYELVTVIALVNGNVKLYLKRLLP